MENKGQQLIDRYLDESASEKEKILVERFYLDQFRKSDFPDVNDPYRLKVSMWRYAGW